MTKRNASSIAFFCRLEGLTEVLISSLRKGAETEGKLAAMVTSLFFVQLGEPNDELYQQYRDVILPVVRDETKPASMRASVCWSIFIDSIFDIRFFFC